MCEQISKMRMISLANNEKEINVPVVFDDSVRQIKTYSISADGNCLVGALAHQSYGFINQD